MEEKVVRQKISKNINIRDGIFDETNASLLKKKQKALAEEASEDDVPSDVDMNDPYFAEEAKKIGKPAHICNFQLESKVKKVTWVETV